MNTAVKSNLAKKNLEMEKLEKSEKSHLRMISSSAVRLKLKYHKPEDPNQAPKESGAKNVRMYETHFPGFCYLRNGEYRKKITNQNTTSNLDPVQCSEKVKEILFTNSELDIYKTMCLHLLGTHIENKYHIQRKDGRLCSYVKAQSMGNTPHTLQPISQRVGFHSNDLPTKYDKMLPRYILDVNTLNFGISTPSVKTSDVDSESDEESKKKRRVQVPIYINNEIRIIINSVLEALEAVRSTKLNDLTELASSPEELRNMLTKDDIQDFINELAYDPLITQPTSYDYVMSHLMFDKIPEKGTLETVAQVLEVYDNSELKFSLQQIRKGILHRHLELVQSNVLPQKRNGVQGKSSLMKNNSKISNQSNTSLKYLVEANAAMMKQDLRDGKDGINKHTITNPPSDTTSSVSESSQNFINKKRKKPIRDISRSVSISQEKASLDEFSRERDEDSVYDASYTQSRSLRMDTSDTIKYDLHRLSNSERILLGLKVASMKSTPMHQFEGKKKIDLAAILNPIIHPQENDNESQITLAEKNLSSLSQPEKKVKKSGSKSSAIQSAPLVNLNRGLLANLRLEISETENKKRLNQFIATIS